MTDALVLVVAQPIVAGAPRNKAHLVTSDQLRTTQAALCGTTPPPLHHWVQGGHVFSPCQKCAGIKLRRGLR